jgi:hypothetical protein
VTKPLLVEHDDGVNRVTLNRPESLNALVLCSRSEEFSEGLRGLSRKAKACLYQAMTRVRERTDISGDAI